MEDHAALLRLAGHAKIELFDAITKKKTFETHGHNLFTNYGLERFKRMSHLLIGGQFGVNAYFNENNAYGEASNCFIDQSDFGFMKYIYLTDNASAVSASDTVVPGTVTGYAGRDPYTGTDTLRGSVNTIESFLLPGRFKAVFDFATDKGNGTHKTICWAAFTNTEYDTKRALDSYTDDYRCTNAYAVVVESDDGYLYAALNSGTYLYKLDPTTLAVLATYTMAHTIYMPSDLFEVVGGVCYHTSSGGTTLYAQVLSTAAETSHALPSLSNSYGCAAIGGYLYYTYNGYYVVRVNLSDLSYTSQYNATLATLTAYRMVRMGSNLYAITQAGLIYSYDWSTNTATATGNSTPVSPRYIGNVYSLSNLLYVISIASYYYGNSTRTTSRIMSINFSKSKANMITAKLLDSPVTKNSSQTMKVTYTITIT